MAACGGSEPTAPPCPQVAFLADASEITKFRNDVRPDENDVVYRAAMANLSGGCIYLDDAVEVDVDIEIVAQRGPALAGETIEIAYFVAVTDPADRILGRQEFRVSLDLDEDDGSGGVSEALRQLVPLPRGIGTGPEHQILMGFELTPSELRFNRTVRGIGLRRPGGGG